MSWGARREIVSLVGARSETAGPNAQPALDPALLEELSLLPFADVASLTELAGKRLSSARAEKHVRLELRGRPCRENRSPAQALH